MSRPRRTQPPAAADEPRSSHCRLAAARNKRHLNQTNANINLKTNTTNKPCHRIDTRHRLTRPRPPSTSSSPPSFAKSDAELRPRVVKTAGRSARVYQEPPASTPTSPSSSRSGNAKPTTAFAICFSLLCVQLVASQQLSPQQQQQQQQQQPPPPHLSGELSVVASVRQSARLPCAIGPASLCGEPYIVAWYKLQHQQHHQAPSPQRTWTRLELATSSSTSANKRLTFDLAAQLATQRHSASMSNSNFDIASSAAAASSSSGAAASQVTSSQRLAKSHAHIACGLGGASAASAPFDCVRLELASVEASDEGQYKCEVTYTESADFSKCPASTSSRLNVVGK